MFCFILCYFIFLPFIVFIRDDLKNKTKKLTHHDKKKTKSKSSLKSSSSVTSLHSKTSEISSNNKKSPTKSLSSRNSIRSVSTDGSNLKSSLVAAAVSNSNSPSNVNSSSASFISNSIAPTSATTQSTVETDETKLSSTPLMTNETTKTILSTNTVNTLISDQDFYPISSTDIPASNIHKESKTPVILDIPNFQSTVTSTTNNNNNITKMSKSTTPKSIPEKKSKNLTDNVNKTIKKDIEIISDEIEKDIPNSKDVESFFEKIKKTLIYYYSETSTSTISLIQSTSKSLINSYNSFVSIISNQIAKFIDFTKYYYLKSVETVNTYPLIAYDALYLTASALIGGLSYTFHKEYLTKRACESCHGVKVNNLHIAGAVVLCLSIMGAGNYLYLKKSKKA